VGVGVECAFLCMRIDLLCARACADVYSHLTSSYCPCTSAGDPATTTPDTRGGYDKSFLQKIEVRGSGITRDFESPDISSRRILKGRESMSATNSPVHATAATVLPPKPSSRAPAAPPGITGPVAHNRTSTAGAAGAAVPAGSASSIPEGAQSEPEHVRRVGLGINSNLPSQQSSRADAVLDSSSRASAMDPAIDHERKSRDDSTIASASASSRRTPSSDRDAHTRSSRSPGSPHSPRQFHSNAVLKHLAAEDMFHMEVTRTVYACVGSSDVCAIFAHSLL